MIGIDLTDQRGVIAAFQENRPAILGEGGSFAALAGIARAQLGEACMHTTAALAVPAWFNDEQRKSIAEQARSAGWNQIGLINRPAAVALAYSALLPADRSNLLVLELEADRFGVTVLAKSHVRFEVLGADGKTELNPILASDPAKLFGEVESATLRALKQAGIGRKELNDILCAGRSDRIAAIQTQLVGAFGRCGFDSSPPGARRGPGSVSACRPDRTGCGPARGSTTGIVVHPWQRLCGVAGDPARDDPSHALSHHAWNDCQTRFPTSLKKVLEPFGRFGAFARLDE